MSALSTGISGLLAFQRALEVHSRNIANVNTEGHVREDVQLASRGGGNVLSGGLSGGVDVARVRREVNEFLLSQARTANASASRADVYAEKITKINGVIASTGTGFDESLQALREAFEGVATEPTSRQAREAWFSQLESSVARFIDIDNRLKAFDQEIDGRLSLEVGEINRLTTQISEVNRQIVAATALRGAAPSDLMDARDRALDELAEITAIQVSRVDNNGIEVKTARGVSLVQGGEATRLAFVEDDFDRSRGRVVITSLNGAQASVDLVGGTLGGLNDARNQILDPTRDEIGRIIFGLTEALNSQNQLGQRTDGVAGHALLGVQAPRVLSRESNVGDAEMTVVATRIGELTGGEYLLEWQSDKWVARDARTGTALTVAGSGTVTNPLRVGGLDLIFDATKVADRDQFLVRPTRDAIDGLQVLATSGADLAAAGVNTGPGNNLNGLALAETFGRGELDNGTLSFADAAVALKTRVGSASQSAEGNSELQRLTANDVDTQRASAFGVSLDEEAAQLIRFQQSYQAAAQIIRVSNEIFDTLISVAR
jgi:flagellar hook-associated protein 1 FlgK